ncbi:MAG: hypothetical protein AAB515_04260 [Patescibacteria group bacterium]
MRNAFFGIIAGLFLLCITGQTIGAQAVIDVQNESAVQQSGKVKCTDFEVIVNRDTARHGLQFIILSNGKYGPYHPSMAGDTLCLELLHEDLPRLPTKIPEIKISDGQTVCTIQLRVQFVSTALVTVFYSPDSMRLTVLNGIAHVSIRAAQCISDSVVGPMNIPKKIIGSATIERYLKKLESKLEGTGSIVCLPAGYYQAITEPLQIQKLGQKYSVNELDGQRVFFVKLADCSPRVRAVTMQILSEMQ